MKLWQLGTKQWEVKQSTAVRIRKQQVLSAENNTLYVGRDLKVGRSSS
jgi:hypothetical protein